MINPYDIVRKMIDETPRNEWGKWFENINSGDASSIDDYACSLSVIAAEISAYACMRGGNGCGDHGHDAAMKAVEKKRKRVRKALGYSYP